MTSGPKPALRWLWLVAGWVMLLAPQARSQAVTEWLVLGSFPVEEGRSFDTDFIVSEAVIHPHGGLMTSGRPWRHYQTPGNHLDFLDLTLDFFPVENAVAYAHIYVRSPKADTVVMTLGYDDQVIVRVNGQVAYRRNESHAHRFDDDTIKVALQEGWNGILFKVFNGVGEWALSARFPFNRALPVQAEIADRLVTIPKPSPELVRIRTVEPADRALFTRDNKPALLFKTVLYNPQQRGLGRCRARLVTRSGKPVGEEQVLELRAGEIRTVFFVVPAATILASFEASGSWQIRLQFDRDEVRRVVPLQYDGRLLGKILGTFEVEGVEPLATNGSLTFRREIIVPWEWAGMPLLFSADLGAGQGDLFVNGEQKAFNVRGYTGDILLTDNALVASRFEVMVSLTNPTAAAAADSAARQMPPPRFYLTVENLALMRYLTAATLLQQFRGETLPEQKVLDEKMFAAMKARDPQALNLVIAEANAHLPEVPEALASVPSVSLVASASVDRDGLASSAEVADAYRATFQQATRNLDKYPGFYFSQGEAATYALIEQQDPQLFSAITAAVQQNRWEVVGGTWVEPDLQLPAGESLVRQFLFGKRYFKEKFGVEPKTAWMTGVQGHPHTLPQILRKSGISAHLFYRPGETMKLFQWEGLEGSRVLAYRPPEGCNTPLTRDVGRQALVSKQRFNWPKALRLYGVGHPSTGPAGRDIRLAEDLAYVTAARATHLAVPTVRMARSNGFFEELTAAPPHLAIQRDDMSVYEPGAWINQNRHKRNLRHCEVLLPMAEAFAMVAREYGYTYPQSEFNKHWRNVLASQHHHLMSGSAAGEFYAEAQRQHREATETAKAALDKAMTAIEGAIQTKSSTEQEVPVVVHNPSAWPRTDYVEVELTLPPPPHKKPRSPRDAEAPAPVLYFRDPTGLRLPVQILARDSTAEGIHHRLLFLPEQVPALGYKVCWLYWGSPEEEPQERVRVDADKLAMSNRDFTILVDARTGALSRLVDSQLNREWIAANTGGLEIWGEKGGPNTVAKPAWDRSRETLVAPEGTEVIEAGPLRGRLRTRFQHGNSTITQDYVVYATLPRIEVQFEIDWQEHNKTLMLVYPFALPEGRGAVEIPFGAHAVAETGEFSPMQRWFEFANEQFGVTLLNTGTFAVQLEGNTVRLPLLRSSELPDPQSDAGTHQLAFALMPHKGEGRLVPAARLSRDFNQPLFARVEAQHTGSLPPAQSFVSLEPANVMLSALKKSEDDDSWVIRLYESAGAAVNATLTLPFAATAVSEVNLLEGEEKPTPLTGNRLSFNLGAWEVKTLKVRGRTAGK